jgi:hypothetical protein
VFCLREKEVVWLMDGGRGRKRTGGGGGRQRRREEEVPSGQLLLHLQWGNKLWYGGQKQDMKRRY